MGCHYIQIVWTSRNVPERQGAYGVRRHCFVWLMLVVRLLMQALMDWGFGLVGV